MEIGRIQGATRTLGKSQGYYGLPVRDSVQHLDDLPQMLQTMGFNSVDGNCPVYITAWIPNPDELARLNAGAAIQVHIVGIAVQPMNVAVGDPPEPVPALPESMMRPQDSSAVKRVHPNAVLTREFDFNGRSYEVWSYTIPINQKPVTYRSIVVKGTYTP